MHITEKQQNKAHKNNHKMQSVKSFNAMLQITQKHFMQGWKI